MLPHRFQDGKKLLLNRSSSIRILLSADFSTRRLKRRYQRQRVGLEPAGNGRVEARPITRRSRLGRSRPRHGRRQSHHRRDDHQKKRRLEIQNHVPHGAASRFHPAPLVVNGTCWGSITGACGWRGRARTLLHSSGEVPIPEQPMQFLFLRANDLRFGATSQSPLRGYQQPRKHGRPASCDRRSASDPRSAFRLTA